MKAGKIQYLFFILCIGIICIDAYSKEKTDSLLIDDFEAKDIFYGRSGTYNKNPSNAKAKRAREEAHSGKRSLGLFYKKNNEGGPYGHGGWCGYYLKIKKGTRTYFDASNFSFLCFWVKGKKGDENFKVGLSDEDWEMKQDSQKSEPVASYIESGTINKEWQKVKIPLDIFWVDHKKLASISICFDTTCYPEGKGMGIVYIDDIQFE